MNRLRQFIFCLAALAFFSAQAQDASTIGAASASPNEIISTPPLPPRFSPVTIFRELLAMSAAEQERSLTNRPPEARARIIAKLSEYEQLDPDERELRLRATELRWWLTPLLRTPRAERAAKLTQVPENLRGLVQERLTQWDILPPPLQEEFLKNEQALHYFAHVETTNHLTEDAHHQQISRMLDQFFALTPDEKQQTLNTLSGEERNAIETTLQSFSQLSPQQRFECLHNYAKFAGMSAAERAEFLKNAESWSKLSPKERQTWRDLVADVPQWPPMPQSALPPDPTPPAPATIPPPSMATNQN